MDKGKDIKDLASVFGGAKKTMAPSQRTNNIGAKKEAKTEPNVN